MSFVPTVRAALSVTAALMLLPVAALAQTPSAAPQFLPLPEGAKPVPEPEVG